MNECSLGSFREEQRVLRAKVLTDLREAESAIRESCKRYVVCCRDFVERLSTTPKQVTYRYHRTRDAILDRLDQIENLRAFLVQGKSGDFLVGTTRLFGKAAVARMVIGNREPRRLSELVEASSNTLYKEAVRVLDVQRAELERMFATHDEAWSSLVSAAVRILKCVEDLTSRGVVSTVDPAIDTLKCVLLYVFWEEVPQRYQKIHDATTIPSIESLKTRPLVEVLNQSFEGAAKSIAVGIPEAIEHMRHKLLREAARQLVARLEAWQEGPRFSSLELAILSLHFTFTSARAGLGGLGTRELRYYYSVIDDAAEHDILDAVRCLVRKEALLASDFDVFRYMPSVWRAVERSRARRR